MERSRMYATLAAVPDALLTLDAAGRVEYLNRAAEQLTGVSLERARKLHAHAVVHLCDNEGRTIVLPVGADEDATRSGSGHLRTHAGTIDVSYVVSRIETTPPGTMVMLRDITEEHRAALRLSFEALHDPLTGLPNRRAVLEQIDEAIAGARDRGEHHALAFLDLDGFKAVNDSFGHAVGDRVLADLARVMGRAVRAVDVIARIGGDEFVILLNGCRMSAARGVTDKVRDAVFAHVVSEGGVEVPIGVSIGLAPIEAGTTTAEAVLASADAACYQQKASRRGPARGSRAQSTPPS
jgi:diguanylate cyclase (GGDEF)-like protein/PAS domain S-box-containing protein